jgi:hypothetical protein
MRILVYEGLASAHDLFLEKLKKVYPSLFCFARMDLPETYRIQVKLES